MWSLDGLNRSVQLVMVWFVHYLVRRHQDWGGKVQMEDSRGWAYEGLLKVGIAKWKFGCWWRELWVHDGVRELGGDGGSEREFVLPFSFFLGQYK